MTRDAQISDTFTRIAAGDRVLLAQLAAGEQDAVRRVTRVFTVTSLARLRQHSRMLVEVLAVCPQLHDRLRHAWGRQDAAFTAQLLRWAAQRSHRPVAA